MKLATIAVALCIASGCKKSGPPSSKEFANAGHEVAGMAHTASSLIQALGRGETNVTEVTRVMLALRRLLDNQPKVAADGELGDCTNRWYETTDALGAALDPLVQQEVAWAEVQASVTHALCNLRSDAKACLAPLEKGGADLAGFEVLAETHAELCD